MCSSGMRRCIHNMVSPLNSTEAASMCRVRVTLTLHIDTTILMTSNNTVTTTHGPRLNRRGRCFRKELHHREARWHCTQPDPARPSLAYHRLVPSMPWPSRAMAATPSASLSISRNRLLSHGILFLDRVARFELQNFSLGTGTALELWVL